MTSTTFIPFSALPQRDYYTVALCRESFDNILKKNKVRAKKKNVKEEGGACRVLGIALASGRYAQLVVYDTRPETIEILLETFRMRFAYRSDLETVAELIEVPISRFSWVVSDDVVRFR